MTHISAPDLLEQIVGAPEPVSPGPPPARVAELEAAIARSWEPFAAGKVPQGVAERLAAPYVAELDALRAEYAPQPSPPRASSTALAARLGRALVQTHTLETRRELLAALNVRLYIGPDGPERLTLDIP